MDTTAATINTGTISALAATAVRLGAWDVAETATLAGFGAPGDTESRIADMA
ncbi:hypothetical protein GCM10027262_78150 [Nocardia tengchongensis]